MKRLFLAGSIAGLLALAACGGGGSSNSAGPAAPAQGAARTSGTLAFTLVIPAATTPAAATRRPAYVSPATNSVAFQIGTATPQVVTVTPGSATCPASGAGTFTCTANANVAAGSGQHLTVTTYASTNGTGTALSTNTLVVNIVANQNNPVAVTLNGVAASFTLSALPASVTTGTASSIVVTYAALDASGNTIVGPGSIVNSAGTTLAPALATTNTSAFTIGALSGNSWTVNYNGAAAASPVTFTVSNAGVTSANTVAAVTSGAQTLFVANVTGTTNTVEVYAPPYTGAPTATVTNGLTTNETPFYVAVGASGDLFVPSAAGVQIYAPPYTGAPTTVAIAGGTNQVALDASGNLFSSNANNTITEYAPPYTGAAEATISTGVSSPETMALDSADDLFVTNVANDTVTAYTPPYTAAPTVMSGPCSPSTCFEIVGGSIGVVPGTHDPIFTSDPYGTYIYDSPWTLGPAAEIQFPPSASYDGSWGLAFDSSNDLFVSYTATNAVAEYVPPYTGGPAVTITNGVSSPRQIAIDRSNNLFVTNVNGTVTEYAPPYTAAPVTTISADTGGAYPYGVTLSP